MRIRLELWIVALGLWLSAAPVAAAEPGAASAPAAADTLTAARAENRWSLARCIATALQRNGDVRAARARTTQARGAALSGWSGVLPSVSANLNYLLQIPDKKSSVRGSVDADPAALPDSLLLANRSEFSSAEASVQMNLLSVPALSEKRRLDHLRASAEHGEAEARNAVVFEVKRQYFDLLKAERLAQVSRESEKLARDEETRAQALFEVGTVARGDVLKAKARRASTVLERIRTDNQVEIQRAKLRQRLGLEPETVLDVEEALEGAVTLPDSASSIHQALRTRSELSRSRAAERAARAGLFGARAARLPSVTGAVGVDRARITERLEIESTPVEFDDTRYSTRWQASLRLSVPIFDGLALEGGMRSAKGNLLEAEALRRQSEFDIVVQVQEAWLTLREASDRIAVAEEGLASAEEDYKFSKGRYDLGAGTFLDLLTAEVSLSQAKQSHVAALADARVAEAALELAIGERRY